ncbi:hypothetical protein [Mesorhizobium sp.]|uniref:hypothetical protein n=1 Tax=Mesorhizobium sp. TaxID=1871066 RepID=UPI00120537B2|nr:hypothetical protein [Mesorhizobium sp.]TIN82201.1 MAG: hypothetical protein E5X97_31240 [Mesorhizobium sp.]
MAKTTLGPLGKRILRAMAEVRDLNQPREIEVNGITLKINPADHRPGTRGYRAELHYTVTDRVFRDTAKTSSVSGASWVGNSLARLAHGYEAAILNAQVQP